MLCYQETVQAILEIKFSNIIVEILTLERKRIFGEDSVNGDGNGSSPQTYSNPNFIKLPSQRFVVALFVRTMLFEKRLNFL